MNEKQTFKTLKAKTGLSKQAIQHRINNIDGIKKRYDFDTQGKLYRYFTDEDAEKILNYQAKKPGRKT
jgi:transcriptional antiterminator